MTMWVQKRWIQKGDTKDRGGFKKGRQKYRGGFQKGRQKDRGGFKKGRENDRSSLNVGEAGKGQKPQSKPTMVHIYRKYPPMITY